MNTLVVEERRGISLGIEYQGIKLEVESREVDLEVESLVSVCRYGTV